MNYCGLTELRLASVVVGIADRQQRASISCCVIFKIIASQIGQPHQSRLVLNEELESGEKLFFIHCWL